MTIQDVYEGYNESLEREELRIVIDGKDLFFGTGKDEEGDPLTIEASEAKLKADKNWKSRVRIIDKVSQTTGNPYQMAVLSDVVKKRSFDL